MRIMQYMGYAHARLFRSKRLNGASQGIVFENGRNDAFCFRKFVVQVRLCLLVRRYYRTRNTSGKPASMAPSNNMTKNGIFIVDLLPRNNSGGLMTPFQRVRLVLPSKFRGDALDMRREVPACIDFRQRKNFHENHAHTL